MNALLRRPLARAIFSRGDHKSSLKKSDKSRNKRKMRDVVELIGAPAEKPLPPLTKIKVPQPVKQIIPAVQKPVQKPNSPPEACVVKDEIKEALSKPRGAGIRRGKFTPPVGEKPMCSHQSPYEVSPNTIFNLR